MQVSDKVCVDASLARKLVVRKPYSDQALAIWENWVKDGIKCIAPSFFPFEVASVIRGRHIRKELTFDETERAFTIFIELMFSILAPESLLKEAWDMTRELGPPTLYDTAYLAFFRSSLKQKMSSKFSP